MNAKSKPKAKQQKAVRGKPKGPAKARPKAATERPARQDIDRKKKLAYTLYVENGFEQKVIAEITGISEQSISAWKRAGSWDVDRHEARMGFDQQRRNISRIISTMLEQIDQRKPPCNVPDSKESDTLNKLADTVKKLQTELSYAHKAEAGKQFILFIQKVHSQEKAIEIVELWHEFIMQSNDQR
ncbi:hypothetical protein F0L74_05960 [Chitinophaga agrisoli]|uniref:Terminase ATPase subunit N-terminal domain-containing protein n=1 Tax=Chitinophaga agrisoli TaxID=2607653 RepID=A0A5B2W1G8_9BACT|nr:hypothetical protein [Chitinophaga agrisoli]KAA2245501.1 hypothetical protein F0L74_05960 [Chitinophaga agrisoli]